MAFSLYAATIPSCSQILTALAALLKKADAFAAEQGIEAGDIVRARLAEDMLPFGYQVKSVVGHSLGAIEGVRKGVFSPDRGAWPEDMPGLEKLVADALDALAAIDPAEVDGFIGRPMCFSMGDMRMDFTAENFLLSFSQPNFYFHATTAYDILRWKGVPLGKRDFMGMPRIIR
jgi:hypothetical protein